MWLAGKLKRPHGSKWLWVTILALHVVYTAMMFSLMTLLICVFWCSKSNREYHLNVEFNTES